MGTGLIGETISAMQWGSAAVAVVGAAASIAGLLRYFAVQSRAEDGPPAPEADGWTPVLGRNGD